MNILATQSSSTTDAGLVGRAAAGDTQAFGELVERYHRLAAAVAFGVLGDLDERDDAVQEGFVRAWNDLSKLKEPSSFKSWLCGIVRHCALTVLRRRTGAERAEQTGHGEPDLMAGERMPDEQLALDEEAALLGKLVQALPASYREPLILFWEDQRVDAVAELLGLSPDAVKQRLARGRELLRDRVQAALGSALERRRPDRRLVAAVLAALPLSRVSAQASQAAAWRSWVAWAAVLISAAGGFAVGHAPQTEPPATAANHRPGAPPVIRHPAEPPPESPKAAPPTAPPSLEEGLIAALGDEEPASSFRRCAEIVAQWPADDFAGAVHILREHAAEAQIAWAAPLFALLWLDRAPAAVLVAFENDRTASTTQAVTQTIAVWTKKNPAAVEAWLANRIEEYPAPCTRQAWLAGLAAASPELAEQWRERLLDEGEAE